MSPLLTVAVLGAVALLVGKLARRFVPEIVVFLALGVLIGPQGPFAVINERNIRSLNLVTVIALGLIIFLLGDRLRLDDLRRHAGLWLPLNVMQIAFSGLLVFAATTIAGAGPRLAFILALIAAETGILTVTATVKEERAEGAYTELLLTGVGVTNVAVAVLFGLTLPFVIASSPDAAQSVGPVMAFAQIVLASTAIGLAGGWLLTRFGAAIETSGELLLFLLIVVTGVAGLDLQIDGSVVISTLVSGIYVANRAPWLADRLFAAVRTLEAPIYLVFFVVAGAGIHLDELRTVGLLGAAYVAARTVGKVGGSVLGGWLARPRLPSRRSFAVGIGMLPHAGMAIALVAFVVEQAPTLGDDVSGVVLGSIVLFELIGPFMIRRSLRESDEAGKGSVGSPKHVIPELQTTRDFKRVLIPVGSLAVALPRLPFLLDLVGNLGAELVTLHVSRPGHHLDVDQEPEVLTLIRRIADERNIPCRALHVVSERVAAEIVRAAEEEDADLVVMGEPARASLFEPNAWGLTTQRVVRALHVPVLVYPVDPSDPGDVPSSYLRRAESAEASDAVAGQGPTDEPPAPD